MNMAGLTAMVSLMAVGLCGPLRAEGAATPPPAKAYALPHDFEGFAMDKTDGNPAVMDGKGVVKGGRLAIAAEQPVFVVELER